jgi:hypothetical protein
MRTSSPSGRVRLPLHRAVHASYPSARCASSLPMEMPSDLANGTRSGYGIHEDGVRWWDPQGWRAAAGSTRRGRATSSSGADAFFSFLGAHLYLSPSLSLISVLHFFPQVAAVAPGAPGGGVRGDGVLVECSGGRVLVASW